MFARSKISLVLIIIICFLAATATSQSRPQGIDLSQLQRLKGNKQFERWLWEYQQRAYPLDHIPDEAKYRAFQRTQQAKAAAALTPQSVTGGAWENIGPKPIVNVPTPTTPSPAVGRVADVAVDPTNVNHWLIGAAQGGIWETFDGGSTWSPRTDDQPTLAMGAIAFAPSNRDIVYAGTGEAVFATDAYGGAGVLKSTNGGSSWQLLASSTFLKMTFSDIKVDPTTPNVVLAAVARNGLGGPTDQAGIYKSTNGGVSWTRKHDGIATDLEVNPTNFNIQYAAIGEPGMVPMMDPLNGLYRSFDGGETWSIINGPWSSRLEGVGRVELAVSPSNPEVLYISIQDAFNSRGADLELLGVWRTNNASSPTPSWTALPAGSAFGHNQYWYDHDLTVDPSNPNILYLGGIVLSRFDGFSWATISEAIHVDQQCFAWAGNRLITGNDGGVWSTTNAGTNWTNHNAELSITQFYMGTMHPTDPNFALGGSQDNGTLKWSGIPAWQFIFEGDGAASAISSVNPNIHWAVSAQLLDIRRTTDGGQSFEGARAGINGSGAPFIARFEKCPNNDNLFIAGTDNLWRTTNFFLANGPTWQANGPEMGAGVSIVSMAFAPSDPSCNTYCYATNVGQIMLTTDGGANWRDIDPANSVPNRFITDLAFDPTNRSVLYLTLSGFDEGTPAQPGHIFKTTNSLATSPTWSNISTPVNIPHNALVVDSSAPNNVFVGTDLSVWNSTNGGNTWTVTGTGLPSVAVFDLQINPFTGKLIAFTHGRGAFALPVKLPSPSGLVATAISHARVDITWTAPSGPVHHYELDRKQSISAPFIKIADIDSSTTSFTDLSVSSSVAYLYQVRAVGSSGNSSPPSNMDLATTMSFTDNPLVARVTVVKAQHINELRAAVNAVRAAAGLPQASWTDAFLPGVFVKAIHITEPRERLNQALEVMGLAIPLYTDQPLIPGLIVKRVHVEEVRQTVR